MPRIYPTDWQTLHASGAARRELETLRILAAGLPDHLTVFHGVHWTRVDAGRAAFPAFGEIDFVVVSPAARILLIEQKSGFLEESAGGLASHHPTGTRNVALHLSRALDALRRRLAPLAGGAAPAIDSLLFCPDYIVREPGTAGLAPERIVDATRRGDLCRVIIAALGTEPPQPHLALQVRRFFADELHLVPDVSSMVGRAGELVTRLSGGLAAWARRLQFAPFRLRVVGTAGSGKTQLALALLRDAQAGGRRALYLCYNRPLADHLARLMTPAAGETSTVQVLSFHQLCDHQVRAAGSAPDYARPGEFDAIASQFAALPADPADAVDDLIVDEGQDFQQHWLAPLLERLAPGGRAWWLEDPMQNLYGRPAVVLPNWVTLHADANYRTPRAVLAQVARLCAPERPVEAAAPLVGQPIEWLLYDDTPGLLEATKRALSDALLARFRREDIAIVTYCGRDRSRLLPFERIGPYRLRSWSGRYDLFGTPEYGEGEVLIETVYRFKGQSAPCVVLAEVDFEAFDELARRKLFVGATRASMKLLVVVSARAAKLMGVGAGEDLADAPGPRPLSRAAG